MKKMMLQLESLEVESFEILESHSSPRGTVRAAADTENTCPSGTPSCAWCPTLSCKPTGTIQCFPSPC
jgi:hypothetical protein